MSSWANRPLRKRQRQISNVFLARIYYYKLEHLLKLKKFNYGNVHS